MRSEVLAHIYRGCLAFDVTRWRGGTRLQNLLTHLSPELQCYPLRLPNGTLYVDVAGKNANWLSRGLFIRPHTPYEPHVQRVLKALIRQADTVVDIGANLGVHTLLMSRLAKKVIAFEPNPNILPLLKQTLALRPNVELQECAVLDHSGTLSFFLSPDHCMSSIHPGRKGAVEVSVPCKPLVEAVSEVPDLMKIDAEGSEDSVFRGALPMLDREGAPILIYEDWSPNDSRLWPILRASKANYTHFVIRREGEIAVPDAQDANWCEMLAVPGSRLDWALQQLASASPLPPGPAL